MARSIITRTMILQRIVKNLQEGSIYVTRLGKQIIPKDETELPPRMKVAQALGIVNKEYQKAHNQLYYELVTKPNRDKESIDYTRLRWKKADENTLTYMYKNMASAAEMSRVFNRTTQAISQKLYAMRRKGLISKVGYSAEPEVLEEVKPMEAYREVARTGRVGEDTFRNLVNEYRQVLSLTKSTLTPNGAIEMYWEAK